MSDRYGVFFHSYFDGPTGRQIQAKGWAACILGFYLGINKYSNMLGLYELPLVYVEHDLAVLRSRTIIQQAFRDLAACEFATFDNVSSFVWVREMARIRLGLAKPGDRLSVHDKRQRFVVKTYESLRSNPFLGQFFDRYAVDLSLPTRRESVTSPTNGASNDASMGDARGTDTPPKPGTGTDDQGIRDQGQEQDQRSGSGTSDQRSGSVKAAAAPRLARRELKTEDPDDNVEVITALVTKEILPLRLPDDELDEATKSRCAQEGIRYNSQVVRKAIDSAQFRQQLPRR